jgi:hypothetical protein
MEPDQTPEPGQQEAADSQDRVSEAAREARIKMQAELEGMEERLAKVQERSQDVRRGLDAAHPALAEERKQEGKNPYAGLAPGVAIAYAIIGLPIAGWGIGWLVNYLTGNSELIPILTMAGVALGIAFSYAVIRRTQQ